MMLKQRLQHYEKKNRKSSPRSGAIDEVIKGIGLDLGREYTIYVREKKGGKKKEGKDEDGMRDRDRGKRKYEEEEGI
jgi:hypothetical protein